ncbi:uncharacterized protein LOC130636091 isoform X3 [Hydractinia symbiolongicarpus]|uniref:uncharacterized protein LOC130636091 isoform X3 n=1 Tax=Hydractinia symbiolongicarpus TaxID=13093 RepID=UPI0025509BB5|nr:uncharacterized protein LOC130636091 isoform X3 [Hydractinia symbiolongicarpus]
MGSLEIKTATKESKQASNKLKSQSNIHFNVVSKNKSGGEIETSLKSGEMESPTKKCKRIGEKERLCNKLGITDFCQKYFPHLVEAEIWFENNSQTLEMQPTRPLVLTSQDEELQSNIKRALEDPCSFEDMNEYELSQEYLMDYCGYEFFSIKDMQIALNILRTNNINIMAFFKNEEDEHF